MNNSDDVVQVAEGIRLRPYESLHQVDREWLQTDWHFSFGDYMDPDWTRLGPLRVLNHDWIQGGGGFPVHGHREVEVLTWIVSGRLRHADSSGGSGVITPSGAQAMSAGTGIRHEEHNDSQNEPVHLVQLWFDTTAPDIESRYDQANLADQLEGDGSRSNWVRVCSSDETDPVTLNSRVQVDVAHLDSGIAVPGRSSSDATAYVVIMEGEATLAGHQVRSRDALILEPTAASEDLTTEKATKVLRVEWDPKEV